MMLEVVMVVVYMEVDKVTNMVVEIFNEDFSDMTVIIDTYVDDVSE